MISVPKIVSEYEQGVSTKNPLFRRDILLMISTIKNVSFDSLLLFPENFSLNESEKIKLDQFVARYKKNEPVSKIINRKSFWAHDFFVNENVLDPRPETELIIETALIKFRADKKIKILDIGTGSGCILLSLLFEFKNAVGIGIDVSEKAIEVAEKNKENIGDNRAEFLVESCSEFFEKHRDEKFDLIVSNPPYIKTGDIETLDENVKNFDPIVALNGGEDGLLCYREFSPIARNMLNENGIFILEIGYGQQKDVVKILEENNFFVEDLRNDLAGICRVIAARKICEK